MALIKRNMLFAHVSATDYDRKETIKNSLLDSDDQYDERICILRNRRQIDPQNTTDSDTSHDRGCDLRDCSDDEAKATVKRLQSPETQEHIYDHACIRKCKSGIFLEAQRCETELVDSTSAYLTVRRVEGTVLASAAL